MLRTIKIAAIAAAAMYVSGCTFTTSGYGVSVDNVTTMKNLGETQISVSDFTSSKPGGSSITCRGAGPVATPNKEPFEKYIQEAFKSELKLAGLYSESSPIKFNGHFTKIDFNSNIGAGKWMFELTASSNDTEKSNITSRHEFSTNWVADKACQQVAQAFSPAVQTLIKDLIKDPMFKELVKTKSNGLASKI